MRSSWLLGATWTPSSESCVRVFSAKMVTTPEGWSQAIGRLFFEKYQLNCFDYLPVVAGPQADVIASRTGFPREKMTPYDASRYPFPIVNASVVVRGRQASAPLEFTPLYYGIPDHFIYRGKNLTFPVGGYLIEPFGFTSTPSSKLRDSIKSLLATPLSSTATPSEGEETPSPPVEADPTILPPSVVTVKIPKPKLVISVSEQAGISSSAIAQVAAQAMSTAQGKSLGMTVRPVWNPLSGKTHDLVLADGFGADNTAVHSLLRRKVQKICAMFVVNLSIMEEVDHKNLDESGFADIAALFGVMTCNEKTVDGIRPKDYNQYRQVFPSEDYEPLVEGLRQRFREGKPCTYLLRTRALPNLLVGIPGGHPVDFLLITCASSEGWLSSLPEPTLNRVTHKARLNDTDDEKEAGSGSSKGVLGRMEKFFDNVGDKFQGTADLFRQFFQRVDVREFPYPRTECMDYSPELVNLITNLMTWEVLESKDLFDELLKSE